MPEPTSEPETEQPAHHCGGLADWEGFDYSPEDFQQNDAEEIETLSETRVWGKNFSEPEIASEEGDSSAEKASGKSESYGENCGGDTRFGARWFAPAIGRWVSADRSFVSNSSINIQRPLESNLYSYASGNPNNMLDPTGNSSWLWEQALVLMGMDKWKLAAKLDERAPVTQEQVEEAQRMVQTIGMMGGGPSKEKGRNAIFAECLEHENTKATAKWQYERGNYREAAILTTYTVVTNPLNDLIPVASGGLKIVGRGGRSGLKTVGRSGRWKINGLNTYQQPGGYDIWWAKVANDVEAKAVIEIKRGEIHVAEVRKGKQAAGTGSTLLAAAMEESGLFKSGSKFKMHNIINPETVSGYKAGAKASDTRIGKTAKNALDKLGLEPASMNWEVDDLGKLNITVEVK